MKTTEETLLNNMIHYDYKEKATYDTLHVGQLVVIFREDGGHGPTARAHWFNRRGVFVGNHYEFFPWDKVYLHPKGKLFLQLRNPWDKGWKKWSGEGRQILHEMTCKIATFFMKLAYR